MTHNKSYFDTVREMTNDPDILRAVDKAEGRHAQEPEPLPSRWFAVSLGMVVLAFFVGLAAWPLGEWITHG